MATMGRTMATMRATLRTTAGRNTHAVYTVATTSSTTLARPLERCRKQQLGRCCFLSKWNGVKRKRMLSVTVVNTNAYQFFLFFLNKSQEIVKAGYLKEEERKSKKRQKKKKICRSRFTDTEIIIRCSQSTAHE